MDKILWVHIGGIGCLEKAFPRGTKVDVFYDPKDPENNYSIRRPHKHPVLRVFLFLTVFSP